MEERIRSLTEKTVAGKMRTEPVTTEFERTDLFLPPLEMASRRVCAYIRNQEPRIEEESCLTGLLTFDGSVVGDLFNRSGHENFQKGSRAFYNQPVDNLLTFEWQHSVGDFGAVIRRGMDGVRADITASMAAHRGDKEAETFLKTQWDFCDAMLDFVKKCSERAAQKAAQTEDPAYRRNLTRLSRALTRVPEHPAECFYEAVLSLCVCYSYLPDSIGLIDRYLEPYYRQDLARGALTQAEATAILQELFLLIQARIPKSSDRFYRGGESHFCVGGYRENGEDGFTDFSMLIVQALMALPTWIPQISMRWTAKTPRAVFAKMMDLARKDANQRIAFVSDEPRLQALMQTQGLTYAQAVQYTMIGCNELALPGGIVFGFDAMNVARSVERTFFRSDAAEQAGTFDDFYGLFEKELFHDLEEANRIGRGFQAIRSRDCNLVSNFLLDGCIRNAASATQGGADRFLAVGLLIGLPNVIDSLSVTRQLVYDEKRVTMAQLRAALAANWACWEDLRSYIVRKGRFFGNDDSRCDDIARRLMDSLAAWNSTDNYLGKKWLFGNLIGYNEHNKFFGDHLRATPDGRRDGEALQFGIGQSGGRDRGGLTALLKSVALCDPHHVLTGPSVTNVWVESTMVRDDNAFDKLISVLETYFRMGGTHFQFNALSREDLIAAQSNPEPYRSLRVRVSGFSDYFVLLNRNLQNEVIARTVHSQ